ncbi:MAG: rod-binding protein [Fimbriimonadaceae bacterium]|nr:rod-binding protein [Fimbriimonadaceae bacterium]
MATWTNAANGALGPSEALLPSNGRLAAKASRAAKLWQGCCQFEGLLLKQMLQQMRSTVPEGEGLFERSQGRRMMEDNYDQTLADTLSQRGAAGLADSLYGNYFRQALQPAPSDSSPALLAQA